MKTTSHLRMFIIVAMMTASACSDPEIAPKTKPGGTTGNQLQEFHTWVTTWSEANGNNFVGLVSAVPNLDMSNAKVSIVLDGITTRVGTYFDVTRLTSGFYSSEGYFWANAENNILLLNYVGQSPTSKPPFPLEVIIEY